MCSKNQILWSSFGVILIIQSVIGRPLKFPDEQSSRRDDDRSNQNQDRVSPGQSEGRFLNIKNVPNGLFNRLSATNNLQDDIKDYDDQSSGITPPNPQLSDVEDRTFHGHGYRKRPCPPYSPFRSNGRDNSDQGRTFLKLHYNKYNVYGGGHRPQYGTYGGYPCHSLGGAHTHNPHRPHNPVQGLIGDSTGVDGGDGLDAVDGVSSDDPGAGGGTVNRPTSGLGFFGPGGLFDTTAFFQQWQRPPLQAAPAGVQSEPTGPSEVKPVVELNVQDTVQTVV